MNKTVSTILKGLMGFKGTATIEGITAFPIFVGSSRELKAVRELEKQHLVFLFKTNENYAHPSYYVVAAKDHKLAQDAGWREMYVNDACDDVLYA